MTTPISVLVTHTTTGAIRLRPDVPRDDGGLVLTMGEAIDLHQSLGRALTHADSAADGESIRPERFFSLSPPVTEMAVDNEAAA